MNSERKAVGRSFRLSRRGYEGLQNVAKERNTTVNSILNELVEQYIDYEYEVSRQKVMHIAVPFLKFLTDRVPKEELIQFGRNFARTIEGGVVLRQYQSLQLESLIGIVRIYCKYNSIRLVETRHDSKRILIMVHEVGLNYSHFSGSYYKALFEIIGTKVDYTADENAVVFTFDS
jgi:hypothetical protein